MIVQAGFVVRRLLGCTCQPAGTNHKVVKVVRRHLASLATSVAGCPLFALSDAEKKNRPLIDPGPLLGHTYFWASRARPGPSQANSPKTKKGPLAY